MNRSKRPVTFAIALPLRNSLSSLVGSFKSNTTTGGFDKEKTVPQIKKMVPVLILVAFIIGVGSWAVITFRNFVSRPQTDTRVSIVGAKKFANINKQFAFSIKDDKGKEVTKMKYIVESAELRDEIVVKGQRMVTVTGRTFLIVSIKLTNDYDKGIDFNTRDFIRVTVNNSSQMLAADIHNDPVSVQPVSTKSTRLGFPINDTDKNLVLHIGADKKFDAAVPIVFK